MARKIQVEIIGDSSSLEKAFGRADKSSSKLGKSVSSLGKVGIPILGGAIAAFGIAVKNGFDELSEAQKVTAQTNAVLKATGGVANVTTKQVTELAESISRMSGIDDEAIQQGQNLLLTFKKVRNEVGKSNKIFDRATKAAVDLSVAGFGSIDSSAKMLGKALNDPIRGMTALSRAGVTFTQEQKDLVKELVESNRELEAQKLILREVESQVGGSARAYGTTFSGQIGKLKVAFDELTGALAKGMLPIVSKVARVLTEKFADPAFMRRVEEFGRVLTTKVVAAFEGISDWFQTHWDSIKSALRTAKELALLARDAVQSIAGALRDVASVTPGGSNTMVGAIMGGMLVTKIGTVLAKLGLLQAALVALSNPYTATIVLTIVLGASFFKFGPTVREKILEGLGLNAGPGSKEAAIEVQPPKGGGTAPTKALTQKPRALGGPVMAGMAYRVGERGAETFVPEVNGQIIPNGGGSWMGGDLVVNLDGREIARVTLDHLQHMGRGRAASSRGRFSGQALALT